MIRRLRSAIAMIAAGVCLAPIASHGQALPTLSLNERTALIGVLAHSAEPPPGDLTRLDDAALMARLLEHGRRETAQRLQPRQINRLWALDPQPRDLAAEWRVAQGQGRAADWARSLSPADRRYLALVQARRRYGALVQAGGWPALPAGLRLAPGETSEAVISLRARLAAEGFAAVPEGPPEVFDPPLAAAVHAFQSRRGLTSDGVVGPATLRALNVTAEVRLAQIDANLERWRWSPRPLPPHRVEVDVGAATATLFHEGTAALAMRAVVGDRAHPTPIFVSQLEAVVFNPPWNVPASIAANEILPRAARDPGYLARHHYVWINGRLQQRPGPDNALGQIKFDLPSPFGVYLHDTPAKAAFAREARALSHGCMRLEKPRALAQALLTAQGWDEAAVEAAIARGTTERVALARAVPLLVTYRTAFVEADELYLLPDPYGWDAQLTEALAKVAGPPDGARAALEGESASDCEAWPA